MIGVERQMFRCVNPNHAPCHWKHHRTVRCWLGFHDPQPLVD